MSADWLAAGDEDALEAAVKDAEARTGAELVVVLARQAEPYREAPVLAGAVAALAVLAFILYHPAEFNLHGILPDVVLAAIAGAFLTRRVPGLLRLFTRAERRRLAVERAAKLAFLDHGVGATGARAGILVYYVGLERRLVILPDLGVMGRVPMARFHAIISQFEKDASAGALGPALGKAVRAVGPAVEAEFPRRADDVNELSDRPRVEA